MYRDRKRWPLGATTSAGAANEESGQDGRDSKRTEPLADEHGLREMGYAFVDLVVEYLKGLEGRRVYGPVSPAGMDHLFDEPLPEEGGGLADLIEECRNKVFPNTMAIGSRRYFGMMNPTPLPVAIFAEALCAAMNQNVASWRHAPARNSLRAGHTRKPCDRSQRIGRSGRHRGGDVSGSPSWSRGARVRPTAWDPHTAGPHRSPRGPPVPSPRRP